MFGPSNCLRHHTASIGSIAMPIENELAPMAPRIEPTEKGRAHASQVEKACGAGGKASYDCHTQYSPARGTKRSWDIPIRKRGEDASPKASARIPVSIGDPSHSARPVLFDSPGLRPVHFARSVGRLAQR